MTFAVDLLLTAATLTREVGDWPVGSVWFNPGADDVGAIGGGGTADNATTYDLPYPGSTAYTPVPNQRKAIVTAPPDSSGLILFGFTFNASVRAAGHAVVFRPYIDGGGSSPLARVQGAAGTVVPGSLVGVTAVGAGETREVVLYYSYSGAPTTTTQVIYLATFAVFLPGLVALTADHATAPPPLRYWDGDSWRPEARRTAAIDVTLPGTTATPGKTATATTISRTPAALTTGQIVTLTSTTAPASSGSVTFYRAASLAGPWTSLGAVTVSAGKASKTWAATVGTWYFRAVYSGSSTHAGSSGNSAATTVTKPATKVVTKTVTASWVQAYDGGGDKISGSSHDGAASQGYYSATHGNQRTLIRFDHGLSYADVTKVELRCTSWAHWYYNAGGTLRVGWHGLNNEPAHFTVAEGVVGKSAHKLDTGGFTITLGDWAANAIRAGDFRGIVLGPGGSTSPEYYGYASTGPAVWKLLVTYRTEA